MDVFAIMQLVSEAESVLPILQGLTKNGLKGLTPSTIGASLPQLEPLLAKLGALVSPSAESTVHATIAATALVLQGQNAKAVQTALNAFLSSTPGFTPLAIDGQVGPRTSAAIKLAQQKAGIPVDGWLGSLTAEAIGFVFKPKAA